MFYYGTAAMQIKAAFRSSRTFGYLLNLLLPGAGHILWREILFGAFIFLIMLLAIAIFMIQYVLPLPRAATWILLGLPAVFYLFTFVDLSKTMSTKRAGFTPQASIGIILLTIGLAYQFLAPSAPLNFMLRNFPDVFVIHDSHLAPLYSKGDVANASRLAYSVEIPFLNRPVFHSLPKRFDLVRLGRGPMDRINGFVVGLPGEGIELSDGVLLIDGMPAHPKLPQGFRLTGDWPLTQLGSYSILVATFNLGSMERLQQAQLSDLVGRIDRFY